MAPKIFWSAEGGRGRVLNIVLEVHVFGLKRNRLEPDGPPARRAYASESDWCGSTQVEP